MEGLKVGDEVYIVKLEIDADVVFHIGDVAVIEDLDEDEDSDMPYCLNNGDTTWWVTAACVIPIPFSLENE